MGGRTRWTFVFGLVTLLWASPLPAVAQTPTAPTTSDPQPTFRIPKLMLSVGMGGTQDTFGSSAGGHVQTVSAQYLLGRHLVLEGEGTTWKSSWNYRDPGRPFTGPKGQTGFTGRWVDTGSHDVWSVGTNVLFRTEPRRVSAFGGAGAGLARQHSVTTFGSEGCVAPGFESYCSGLYHFEQNDTRPFIQAVGGADVRITSRLIAYTAVRLTSMEGAYLQVTGGVRLVTLTRPGTGEAANAVRRTGNASVADSKTGQNVRVTLSSGERAHGTLVSLANNEVHLLKGGNDVRYSLDAVALVETTHHAALKGAIIGGVGGFLAGWLGSCGQGDEEDCWPEVGAMFGGIGAGVGAAIGGAIDHANAAKHVVYVKTTPSVRISPVVTPKRAGIALALGW